MLFKGTNLQLADKYYKFNWRSNAQYSKYSEQFCIIVIQLARRLDLNYSNPRKEIIIMCSDRGVNYRYTGNQITIY